MQAWLGQEQALQEAAQRDRQAIVDATGGADQRRLAVDVPAKDVDLPLSQQQRVAQRCEIIGSVVENRDPARFAPFPDGLAGDEDG